MRDVITRRMPTSTLLTQTWPGPPPGATQTRREGTMVVFRSQRSDSMPTIPSAAGHYFRPTGYEAFFSTVVPRQGATSWINTLGTSTKKDDLEALYSWTAVSADDCYTYGCQSSLLYPAIPNELLNRVRNSLVSQIRGSDFNVSTFLGEAREAGTLMKPIYDGIKEADRRFHIGLRRFMDSPKYKRATQNQKLHFLRMVQYDKPTTWRIRARLMGITPLGTLAAAYLTYMYAIRPLISDLWAILSGLSFTAQQSDMVKIRSRILDPTFSAASWPGTTKSKWLTGKCERGVLSEISYGVMNPHVFDLWRYGLTNPLSLAWELTPLSFVADWFTGFGAFMASLEAPIGISQTGYYETHFVDNQFIRVEDVYTSSFAGPYTRREFLHYAETHVRTKAMRRLVSPFILPAPPFLSLRRVFPNAPALLALIVVFNQKR